MELLFQHPEFEEEVRKQLGVFNRQITEKDALLVTHLDLYNFDFLDEDIPVLSLFKNLKNLDIKIGSVSPLFWHNFVHLEDLSVVCWGRSFDFSGFSKMQNLTSLTVSGGDFSSIDYLNLDSLIQPNNLHYLQLHEFGRVDLSPLAFVPRLTEFALRYANETINFDVIGTMSQLKALTLDGLYVSNLDCLDKLPKHIRLEMCGIHVCDGVDPQKWKRFKDRDICEIAVKDALHSYMYVDLSVLDE